MILSDIDIANRLDDGDLVIDPLSDETWQIQPASVDLRLSNEFLVFNTPETPIIRPGETDLDDCVDEVIIDDEDEFVIHPGDFVLGQTKEWIEIPRDLIGSLQGRSSIGRLAVIVHATAGIIDPGYKGQITLELSNLGRAPVVVKPNMRMGQIMFTELKTPCENPYGEERGSKYQHQKKPQVSKINNDPEFNKKK